MRIAVSLLAISASAASFSCGAEKSPKPEKPEKPDKSDADKAEKEKADRERAEKDKPKGPPEIRMDADGHVVLSRDGRLLAVLVLRKVTAGEQSPAVMTPDAAQALLKDAKLAPLNDGEEKAWALEVPLPTGDRKDTVSVMLNAKRVSQGTRILVNSNVYGLARAYLAPGESLPKAEELEIAVQLFKDAEGALPNLANLNGKRGPAPPETTALVRNRFCDFEGKGGYRVNLTRSGPADWSIQKLPDSMVLRSKLRPDPHELGAFGSFIVYLGGGADEAPPELSTLKLTHALTPARDFIEGYIRVYASGANPYILSELAVVAEIACPPATDGTVSIKRLPCFFWEAPSSDPAEGEFRFRFAAPTEDLYGARLAVITNTGEAHADALPLRSGSPASRGFARLKGSALKLDDGSLFVPVGFNLDFPNATPKLDDYRTQFTAIARAGGNCVRIWLTDRGLSLEGPKAGNFDPDTMAQIDAVLRAAQARDIRVILTLESGTRLGKRSDQHPYFHELGGPLLAAPEFFRDVPARKLFQARLTYAAARFGAFRSVLAWELMDDIDQAWAALRNNPENVKLSASEMDLARRARRDVQDWVEEMALHLKGMDQFEHPVGVSTRTSPDAPWKALESLEHLDFTSTEGLTFNADEKRDGDEAARLYAWAAAAKEPGRGHKGYFVGSLLDRTTKAGENAALLEHNAIFASLACGHLLVPLLDDNLIKPAAENPSDVLAATEFAAGLSEIQRGTQKEPPRDIVSAADAADGAHLRIAGRVARRGLAVWIQDARSTWVEGAESPEVAETEVRLPALSEGSYGVYWLDTRTGAYISSATYAAPAKQIDQAAQPFVIKTPRFKRDIALIVTLKP